jgi:hypothetical protein
MLTLRSWWRETPHLVVASAAIALVVGAVLYIVVWPRIFADYFDPTPIITAAEVKVDPNRVYPVPKAPLALCYDQALGESGVRLQDFMGNILLKRAGIEGRVKVGDMILINTPPAWYDCKPGYDVAIFKNYTR